MHFEILFLNDHLLTESEHLLTLFSFLFHHIYRRVDVGLGQAVEPSEFAALPREDEVPFGFECNTNMEALPL